jgi:beta-xylosidase
MNPVRTSDNADGTFTNPLIFADYPDPDIIRVGRDFYMVSSSFTCVPGIPVCHSTDLLNWTIIGHAYDRLPEENPAYRMAEGAAAYRGGSWAPCIRHRSGKFYIAFCTPAEGFFLCISDRPEGPYERIGFGVELYDPSLLFATDGRVFVAHGANGIRISELSTDARRLLGPPRPVFQSPVGTPLEGSHFYERNGWFYLCLTCRGYNGIQLVLRSREVYGPYEWRIVSGDDMNYAGAGLHQGGFVELEDGETWFFLFQDRDWVGRVPVLQPMRWVDDWPVLGDAANDGKATVTWPRPALPSAPRTVPEGSDSFDGSALHLRWQWNHQPEDSRWSLDERPGWLRLRPLQAPELSLARNTLTQKMAGPECTATTTLDASNLPDGAVAGLCVLNLPYAWIGIRVREGRAEVECNRNGQTCAYQPLDADRTLQLRVQAGADGLARFSFARPGQGFVPFGEPFMMEFTVKTFLGNRVGFFSFQEGDAKGWADFNGMELESARPDNQLEAGEWVAFADYDTERGTDTHRLAEKRPAQVVCDLQDGDWICFHRVLIRQATAAVEIRAGAFVPGVSVEVRRGGADGTLLASIPIAWQDGSLPWKPVMGIHRAPLALPAGSERLYFIIRGRGQSLGWLDTFRVS